MSILDRVENQEAIKAAKAEILAALAKTDGKLDVGVMAQAVKSVQHGVIDLTNGKINVTINEVNVDKAICLSNGSHSLIHDSRFFDLSVKLVLNHNSLNIETYPMNVDRTFSFTVVEFY